MVPCFAKKWPRLVLAAYLVIATAGIFTFMATEPFRSVNLSGKGPASGGLLSPIDHFIDYLTEGITITNKTGGHSLLFPSGGCIRILLPFGIRNIEAELSGLSLKAAENVHHLNLKKTIPLRLRI
ncbi:MAG: hypothetical protein LBI67_11270 [Treponema sp.]|jgi:hypothetical protein|nr:hypothetical protein [Treponema sp.]